MNKRLLINDSILIAIIIIILALSSIIIYEPAVSENITVVYNKSVYGEYSLNKDITETIGDSGVVLEIKNRKAYIKHSDCPDKVCQNGPDITINSSDSASIVCLPNKVSISKNPSQNNKEADVIAG